MTSAADLFALQEVDLSRDSRRAVVADIDSRLGDTEELIDGREAVEAAQSALDTTRKQQQEIERELEDLDTKLNALEAKLYGGSLRNPKELTDLQREVDVLKGKRSHLDDLGLESLDRIEQAAAALETARKNLANVEADWRADQHDLQAERERAETELVRLDAERENRTAGMDATALNRYEALRAAKQGRPVARIERGACQGCRLGLPTYIVQRARASNELVQCPSCERILVGG